MDLLKKTIEGIKPLDKKAMDEAQTRQDTLTKPAGSLGAPYGCQAELGVQIECLPVMLQGFRVPGPTDA